MKYASSLFRHCLAALCVLLVSCDFKADVDLNNIDMTTSLSTSLSLPIGSVSMKLGDFIDSSSFQQITIDEQGRYIFQDTIAVTHAFHPINLSDYMSKTSSRWSLTDEIYQLEQQLKELYPFLGALGSIPLPITIPAGIAFDIEFPIELNLKQFNIDYAYQRVDSVIINLAHFTSKYTLENIDLRWDDIKQIQIILNEHFRRANGDTLDLPLEGKGFDKELPIDIEDFHMILMKDPKAPSSPENIVDSIMLKIRFHIETTHPLTLTHDQYITYDFKLDFIDYSAMFGYFSASNLMKNEVTNQSLASLWSGWDLFNGWIMPVSEPSVKFIVKHALSVPLLIKLKHLYVSSNDGERRYATFDDNYSVLEKNISLPAQIAVTDPLDKHASDTIQLDYTAENGNIDTLFTIDPKSISYAFEVGTDTIAHIQQYRITDDTEIQLNTVLHIPFTFKDGVAITYCDTIQDINLSAIQLDSLLQQTRLIKQVEDAQLQLYLMIENSIPFAIQGTLAFYDANYQLVPLSALNDSILTISIDCPESINNGIAQVPSVNQIPVITITKDDINALSSVRHIVFNAHLGNNPSSATLTPDATLRIQMGVTADADVIVDLKELF